MTNTVRRRWPLVVGCGGVLACAFLGLNLLVKDDDNWRVHRGEGADHFYMVTRNAVSAANPDIRVRSEFLPEQPADIFSVRVAVEPQWARPANESSLVHMYDINKLAVSGETYVMPFGSSYIRHPVFPPSRIKTVLKTMSSSGSDDKRGPEKTLTSLGRAVSVTAVVQYDDSGEMPRRGAMGASGGGNILISSNSRTSLPIYWDNYPSCGERKVSERCDELTQLEEFRLWVSRLRPEDDTVLSTFGLSLLELREAAHHGRIVGHIEVNTDPEELRDMLQDPRVKTIHIVETRLNCAFGSGDVCEPEVWSTPK
ncbi:hypothetical protein [Streptosporangium sp. NPDC023615]|uniref:hypothetical protein n=1 Tax=Streptosporangium sp. NPDC023615 TaxID=3154794 RepID=UPI00343019D5